jgi:hypothetical protein
MFVMGRWLVTYRLSKAGTDRIEVEVEAAGPVAALDAAKRLLPDGAKLVGYRVIAEAPPPEVSQAENSQPTAQLRTTLKAVMARMFWRFSK